MRQSDEAATTHGTGTAVTDVVTVQENARARVFAAMAQTAGGAKPAGLRKGEGRRMGIEDSHRDGVWEKPGLVTVVAKEVPEQRRATTLPGPALEPVSMRASGWPGPDGGPPETVWLTVNGVAAADVEAVELLTDLDRHEARVQSDGSFLTLVRARRREEPRVRLHLTTGETRDESL